MGNDAKILIWAFLNINEEICDLSLLWNTKAEIVTYSYIDKFPVIKTFENLNLNKGEIELNFTVPPNLGEVKISITSQVLKIGGEV